jgi:hypothetical protein
MTEQHAVVSACKKVGTSSSPVWSEGDLDEKLIAMQKALNETIEASERNISGSDSSQPDIAAYLEVLQKAPHLIQAESDPRLFLRRENGDAVAASRRLINYWAKRLKIFGAERAYLPLRFGGALGQEELESLQTGAFVRLPCDRRGRDVYCIDLSRRRKAFGTASSALAVRARFVFYLSAQAFSNPKSQTEGIVILVPLTEKSSLAHPNSKNFADLYRHVLPIRVHSVHIACCPPRDTTPLFRDCLIPSYLSSFCDWSETKNISVHLGKSQDDLVQKLQTHGFQKLGIPENLGGTWDYQIWIDGIVPQLESNNQQATCQETNREVTIDINDQEADSNALRTERVSISCADIGRPFKVRAVVQGSSEKEQLNTHLVESCQESSMNDVKRRRSHLIVKDGQERKHLKTAETDLERR